MAQADAVIRLALATRTATWRIVEEMEAAIATYEPGPSETASDLIMYGRRRQIGPCATLPSLAGMLASDHKSTDISVRDPRT